jgi:hypothetical protein
METSDSFKKDPLEEWKSVLKPGEYLQDYINELYNFTIDEDGELHKLGEMKTVEERFAGITGAYAEGTKTDIAQNPEKVKAINELAGRLNKISTAEEYKALEKELLTLLRG